MSSIPMNRGTGAGGSNTTLNGKSFEDSTDNEQRLIDSGYIKTQTGKGKFSYYLQKKCENSTVTYATQNGFKSYMKKRYNIVTHRKPDEAYITEYDDNRVTLLIIEKKAQSVEGTVEVKLWASPLLKHDYECMMKKCTSHTFTVHYALCVNEFFKQKLLSVDDKYINLLSGLQLFNVGVLYGDDDNYYDTLDTLIANCS